MLSVVIATQDDERALLSTLAALVPGAAAGVVREVILAHTAANDATAQIADIAGCRLMTLQGPRGERLRQAAAAARSAWLLFLKPGLVPDATWIDEARRFIEQDETGAVNMSAAVFRPGVARSITAETLMLLRLALGARPHEALLIAKNLYAGLSGHHPDASDPERHLVRRLGRRRVALLRCAVQGLR
jgi:hypothetical protein